MESHRKEIEMLHLDSQNGIDRKLAEAWQQEGKR
jgi:hypothetical protein